MRQKPSGIVTLITDFGLAGEYVGALKGAILRVNPRCLIVDITHQIDPQNILQASFVLQKSYAYYPPGTVHGVVVDPGVGTERRALFVEKNKFFFVGPDNGVFSGLLSSRGKVQARELIRKEYFLTPLSHTFHGRDVFAPVAGHLSLGLDPAKLGPKVKNLVRVDFPEPRQGKRGITARVLWADSFGNLITNVTREEYARRLETRFQIQGRGWRIDRLSRTYGEEKPGQSMALFGSGGLLEISVNRGNAHRTLGLNPGDSFTIQWRPKI
ncbi:MAG: S-adenosyl-l-methionine hydroxide adenosyltransferase family protein [Planctomycetaceae bacterium]